MESNERTETYNIDDRSRWPSGPWDSEPDRVEWRAHGFTCLARRGGGGFWCGYVALLAGHPWIVQQGSRWPESEQLDRVVVHGGLNYLSRCRSKTDSQGREVGICHTPREGEYRDTAYIVAHVESLARQAAEAVL